MKIVFASDSFKGSLSSEKISELLEEVTPKVFPHAQMVSLAVADGGEGTMSVLVKALDGRERKIITENPLGQPIEASYGLLSNQTAIIEMARASGLPLINNEERHPMKTSSYGTGLLIRDALDNKVNHILIALGGSATNDGGMGAMSALGFRFFDKNGHQLKGSGQDLWQVSEIDVSHAHQRLKEVTITILSDVTNPLLGDKGATYTYSKQKGATSSMQELLEAGMTHFAKIVEKKTNKQLKNKPGAGAAGGLAFSLMAFLNAEIASGIDTILDILSFDNLIKDADLIITGEGRLDNQSSLGKVVSGVAKRGQKQGIPVVAIVGGLSEDYETIYDDGLSSIITTINKIMPLEVALKSSEQLYQDAAYRMLCAIKVGMTISQKNKN
ncbi:glycerate kinase [Streptococcus sp. CSL10205-OR2]|uniref:glycerate kinase n=1 Tax=Streptococcus sp. CSL10205-OR2 TaxID=2980558 RepID=UPI0021DACC6B|nr:glycerate kinase [Streptococcus sp. CSL10205-OR2]MCU9533733.1 glycerate kinase [Streptococcus sp. CSL10205-OR2]